MQLNGTLPRLLVIWHRSRIFDNCSRVWTYARLHHLASPDAQKQGEEKREMHVEKHGALVCKSLMRVSYSIRLRRTRQSRQSANKTRFHVPSLLVHAWLVVANKERINRNTEKRAASGLHPSFEAQNHSFVDTIRGCRSKRSTLQLSRCISFLFRNKHPCQR